MKFEEYAEKNGAHKFLKEYKQREHAWNAAIDAAANVANNESPEHYAGEIATLIYELKQPQE